MLDPAPLLQGGPDTPDLTPLERARSPGRSSPRGTRRSVSLDQRSRSRGDELGCGGQLVVDQDSPLRRTQTCALCRGAGLDSPLPGSRTQQVF